MANKTLEEILKRVRKGELWLLKPTEEYKYQLFQPLKNTRKYAGVDDDHELEILQKKWKMLNLKETINPQSKIKAKNIEHITIWLRDHPDISLIERGIINQIKKDINIPYSTIRNLLQFMKKNNLLPPKVENSLYEKLFGSDFKISFSQRNKKESSK